jgi:hypothetical protein
MSVVSVNTFHSRVRKNQTNYQADMKRFVALECKVDMLSQEFRKLEHLSTIRYCLLSIPCSQPLSTSGDLKTGWIVTSKDLLNLGFNSRSRFFLSG